MKRYFLVTAISALALAVTTPANAQWVRRDPRPSSGYGYSDVRRAAYERGFREGQKEGEKDGRRGDRFRYQDERDFQRADIGYQRRYGDIDRYRQAFRTGFAEGYEQGYSRYGRDYRRGRYEDRNYGYGYPERGGNYSTPFDIGARDGYEKGIEDANKNRSFDARRHEWYREGDHHYNNRYGNRERYKDEYRRGFNVGYQRGYYYR